MKRAAIAVVVLLLLLAGAGVAYYLHVKQQSRDVKGSSTVEFVTTQEAVPARPKEPGVAWPTYGHDPQRLRFANGVTLAPPFKRVWTYRARTLVEFPPAVAYGRLFFTNNAGVLFAIGAKNGRKAWKYVSHRCNASSPAVAGHVVYETFMNAPPCNRKPSGKLTGELVAFTVGHGRVLWRKTIYPSESSPVVTAGSVFVGDWSGRIYAFKQRSGKLRWVTQAARAGEERCLDRRRAAVRRRLLGPRVRARHPLAGRSSGRRRRSGASATPGTSTARRRSRTAASTSAPPTARSIRSAPRAGSFAGRSRRAASSTRRPPSGATASSQARTRIGSSRSTRRPARSSGSSRRTARSPARPTVVAGRVYFATLKGTTYALDATSGRLVWTFPDGKYSPVVADAARLYLIGNARLYGLDERRQVTPRKLSAVTALGVLRRAGFKHVRVIGTRPLALRLGKGHKRSRRNVCHIALFGAEVNVETWSGRPVGGLR